MGYIGAGSEDVFVYSSGYENDAVDDKDYLSNVECFVRAWYQFINSTDVDVES